MITFHNWEWLYNVICIIWCCCLIRSRDRVLYPNDGRLPTTHITHQDPLIYRQHGVIGDWMIPFAVNATATSAAKIASAFERPGKSPKIAPLPWGSAPPFNTWFPGPISLIQNGISIGSAVFAQLIIECPITLQWAATFFPKTAYSAWGSCPP